MAERSMALASACGRRAVRCLGPSGAARRWAGTVPASERRSPADKERIVILGSGWAGYALARKLSPARATRILVSPRSHFVFTPLLASTAVGTLEFPVVTESIRGLGLADFHEARVVDVDFGRKRVRAQPASGPAFDVAYDKLVVAVGCASQTFGIPGVVEHACFLRDTADARAIRSRLLEAFEKAALPTASDADRRRLLHFAVVGGGPTGIEFAAELHDLVHEDLARLYPRLVAHVAITVYDIAPKVLPMFDQNLAAYATDMFARQGIRVRTEHHLEGIRRDGDVLMLRIREQPDEEPAGLVVWSTGLSPNPLVSRLLDPRRPPGPHGEALARHPHTGAIVTDGHMRVQLAPATADADADSDAAAPTTTLADVYAIGDCAAVQGQSLPATAQVASQQAAYLARQLNRGADDDARPFRFRNLGSMAYLGSWRAIHQSSADELKGLPAWLLWRTAYLTRSMSVRNKILIPVYWLMTWIFGRDISGF